jgi:hypothetical protein
VFAIPFYVDNYVSCTFIKFFTKEGSGTQQAKKEKGGKGTHRPEP